MARRYTDFFLDDKPPAAAQQQEITLEQPVSETVAAPVNEAPVVTPEPVSEMTDEAKEALRLTPGSPAFTPEQPAPTPEAPLANEAPQTEQQPGYYKTLEQIKQDADGRYNPLFALMKQQSPVLDEKRQQRLQRIAAVNSIGKGLGTILQGYYGKKGATITPDKNELLPEAYKQYTDNIDEYEKKKDLWNKDMLALSLNKSKDIFAEQQQTEAMKRADAIEANRLNVQAEINKAEMEFRAKEAELDRIFRDNLAKTADAAALKLARERYAHDKAMQKDAYDRRMDELTKSIEGGKYASRGNAGVTSGGVTRQAGTENNPLAFIRGSDNKRIFLKPDQLDIVPMIIAAEATEMENPKDIMFMNYLQKASSDGKLTEAEAQMILSRYAHKYFDFVDGEAVPKGTGAAPQQQQVSTGGAY